MNMTAGKKNWRLMNNLMSLIFEKMSRDDAKKKKSDLIKKSFFGKSALGVIPERFFYFRGKLGVKVGQNHISAKNKGFR